MKSLFELRDVPTVHPRNNYYKVWNCYIICFGIDSSRASCFVAGCFVEVYNEVLRDLGSQDGREGMLDLRDDPVTGKGGRMMPVTVGFGFGSRTGAMEMIRLAEVYPLIIKHGNGKPPINGGFI